MALKIMKEEIKVPNPDIYEAILKDFKEVEKPKFGPSIRWIFEIKDEGEFDGCTVAMITNTKFSGTGKGKLDAIVEALGIEMEFGQELDENGLRDYIGTRVRINVTVDEDAKGNTWANVDKVWRPKKAKPREEDPPKRRKVEDAEPLPTLPARRKAEDDDAPPPRKKAEEEPPRKKGEEEPVKKRAVEDDDRPKKRRGEEEPPKKKKPADDEDDDFGDLDDVDLDEDD